MGASLPGSYSIPVVSSEVLGAARVMPAEKSSLLLPPCPGTGGSLGAALVPHPSPEQELRVLLPVQRRDGGTSGWKDA